MSSAKVKLKATARKVMAGNDFINILKKNMSNTSDETEQSTKRNSGRDENIGDLMRILKNNKPTEKKPKKSPRYFISLLNISVGGKILWIRW